MKHRKRINLDFGWADCDLVNNVAIGDRLVPTIIEVTFAGVDGQPGLTMSIDSSTGAPRCTDLRITAAKDGREVRTTDVRAVALEDWVEIIVSAASDVIVSRDSDVTTAAPAQSDSERREAMRTIREARRSARRKVTPELLRRVAEVYQKQDDRPVVAVEAAFGTSYRTAARYVQVARQQGFLPAKGDG